jgi:hypothetical protein
LYFFVRFGFVFEQIGYPIPTPVGLVELASAHQGYHAQTDQVHDEDAYVDMLAAECVAQRPPSVEATPPRREDGEEEDDKSSGDMYEPQQFEETHSPVPEMAVQQTPRSSQDQELTLWDHDGEEHIVRVCALLTTKISVV